MLRGDFYPAENGEFLTAVDTCSAIFLHNMEDVAFFNTISLDTAALPYLLKLCDELQIWERREKGKLHGYPPWKCDIEINDKMITFFVTDTKIKTKVSQNIACLKDEDYIKVKPAKTTNYLTEGCTGDVVELF